MTDSEEDKIICAFVGVDYDEFCIMSYNEKMQVYDAYWNSVELDFLTEVGEE